MELRLVFHTMLEMDFSCVDVILRDGRHDRMRGATGRDGNVDSIRAYRAFDGNRCSFRFVGFSITATCSGFASYLEFTRVETGSVSCSASGGNAFPRRQTLRPDGEASWRRERLGRWWSSHSGPTSAYSPMTDRFPFGSRGEVS
jgi:hypothetical protein